MCAFVCVKRWVVGGFGMLLLFGSHPDERGTRRSSLAVPHLHSGFTRSSDLRDAGRLASRPQSLRSGHNRRQPAIP